MMKEYGFTQEEVSRSVGKSRPYITNSLRLLKLPQDIREKISEGAISAGHARALLSVKTRALQEQICQKIIKDGMSVRETENLVRKGGKSRKAPARSKKDPDIVAVEEKLKEIYGTRVAITTNGRKGAVEISYYGREDLNRIIELLESVK